MSDGAIHAACMHDFSKYRDNCETDRRAIEAIGSPLAGSNRPLIITAGTALIQEHVAIEDDVSELGSVSRPASRPRHGASTGGRPLEDRTGAPGPLPLSGTSIRTSPRRCRRMSQPGLTSHSRLLKPLQRVNDRAIPSHFRQQVLPSAGKNLRYINDLERWLSG